MSHTMKKFAMAALVAALTIGAYLAYRQYTSQELNNVKIQWKCNQWYCTK